MAARYRLHTEDEWPDKLQFCRWILQMTDTEDVCLYVFKAKEHPQDSLKKAAKDRRMRTSSAYPSPLAQWGTSYWPSRPWAFVEDVAVL